MSPYDDLREPTRPPAWLQFRMDEQADFERQGHRDREARIAEINMHLFRPPQEAKDPDYTGTLPCLGGYSSCVTTGCLHREACRGKALVLWQEMYGNGVRS